jgi:hypothetical protein
MKWKTERRKLKELVKYDKNPRILTDKQKSEIEKSLKKFDLVELPAINTDNTIIAGHQRITILSELYGGDYEIEVRVPDTKLNEKDFKEYLLRSNRNKAEWDWNMLETEFDTELLLGSGFESFEIDVDKLNIDSCFADMESKKKNVKVKNCEICKRGLGVEVKYFIKNNTFDNYAFKETNDEVRKIYEALKDYLNSNRDIHVIIVDKVQFEEKEEEDKKEGDVE